MGIQENSAAAIGRELGLSRSSMSKYKKAGMPVDSVEAARAWRESHVKLTAHGMSIGSRKRSETPTHTATAVHAQLNRSQPTATSQTAQHARALMEIAGAALISGRSIEAMTPDLRAALSAVDEEERAAVPLHAGVMDYLTQGVRTAIENDTEGGEEVQRPHAEGEPDIFEGVDLSAFWYRAAAGEIVATPRPKNLPPMTAQGEHLIELLRRAQNDLDSELHVQSLAIEIHEALDTMPPGDRAYLQIRGVNVWALMLVMSSWALGGTT